MPSYTHFRPAQPVLVAHFFLAHVAPLRRDFDRLAAARAEADALPLGSGAVAGTSYAIDVEDLARELGFSRVVANSIDASSDRDFAAAFLYACTLTMVHLSRLAEDLIILCGDEHRFFEFSDALSTGQQHDAAEEESRPARARARQDRPRAGALVGLLRRSKGLPSGYNKDLQEDKEAVFDAEDTLAGCSAVVGSVVAGLTLNRARAEAAASGLLLATDVADYLVGQGVPFRRAHEIVGALVRQLVAGSAGVRVAVARTNGGRPASTSTPTSSDRVTARGVRGRQADAAVDGARRRLTPGWPRFGSGWPRFGLAG